MKTDQCVPDNPRDWDPNSPQLESATAPHETGAVVRAHRSGIPGEWLTRNLWMTGAELMAQMRKELHVETEAHRRNRAVHDARVSKGTK